LNSSPLAPRQCPVCGSARRCSLFRQSFEHLSGACLLDGYDVVVCSECGAGYADQIPPQSVFDKYYRELSKYDYEFRGGQDCIASADRFLDAALTIEPFIPTKDCRILEIGCGSGHLLKVLLERGFQNVQGSDPSPACARAAQGMGVRAVSATVFTATLPEEPYDFLILTGVLEHIRDLDRTVEQFHRLLKDGGRVYLEVPDASRLEPSLDAPFQEFSVEHINFLSPGSLSNLMQARSFRTVTTGRARRAQNETVCPTAYGVYEKPAAPVPMEKDTETESGLRAYIQGCQAEDVRIRGKIDKAVPPGEHMIVWGVGAHTLRLLATGGLDPNRISVFVDSNRNYQQQELRGIPVVSPDQVRSRTEPILISSRGFQREIHDQIRRGMGLDNPIILLYESELQRGDQV
jgi:SAM-dependent methyltransferase